MPVSHWSAEVGGWGYAVSLDSDLVLSLVTQVILSSPRRYLSNKKQSLTALTKVDRLFLLIHIAAVDRGYLCVGKLSLLAQGRVKYQFEAGEA